MSDIFKQLKKVSQVDIVDQTWIARNKRELLGYMRLHPLVRTASTPLLRRFFRMVPSVAFLSAILLLTTGGMSVAAQGSIPGDLLYPVKIRVENIESAFVFGTQNRAQFEVSRTTKRLEEVTELAIHKNISNKLIMEAQVRLERQVQTTSDTIDAVALENKELALETALQLSSTLEAHKAVLDQLGPKADSIVKPQIQDAINSIVQTSDSVQNAVSSLSKQSRANTIATKTQPDLKENSLAKLESAKKKLNETWELVIKLPEDSLVRIQAEDKLLSAQDALTNAELDIELAGYDSAITGIQAGSKLTAETIALLETAKNTTTAVQQILDTTQTASPSQLIDPSKSTKPTPLTSPMTTLAPTSSQTPTPQVSSSISPTPIQ